MRLHLPRSTLFISVLLLANRLRFLCSMRLVVGRWFCSRRIDIHIYRYTCRYIRSIYIYSVQIHCTGNGRKESLDNIPIPSAVPFPNPTKAS